MEQNICKTFNFGRSLIFRTYQELLQFKNKQLRSKMGTGLEKMGTGLLKKDTQMANKHMLRCSSSLVTREMQIKTTRYPSYPPGWLELKRTDNAKC